MADPDVKRILDRFNTAKSRRGTWDEHWQDLAEAMHPRRADFTTSKVPGERRTEQMYDSGPMLAARSLASSVEGLLTPKTSKWFGLKAAEEELNGSDTSKSWFDEAEERIFTAIYAPKARFIKAIAEAYMDLVVFGTAVMFIGEARTLDNLIFRTIHLRNVYLSLNSDGIADTLFLVDRLTARQAAQRFGKENLSKEVNEQLTKEHGDRDKTIKFIQAVMPREDRDVTSPLNTNMEFASIVIEEATKHKVGESGFHEFPYVIMRWDTSADEDYGRSPGMIALPDSWTLHQMGKTILEAGHKVVDPPMQAPADAIIGVPRAFPGGITYYDAEALTGTGIRVPLQPLFTGANLPVGLDMQKDRRAQVELAFFRGVLNLPVDGPQMTATEILERKDEFARTIGPVFGRLEADGPAVIVERVFGILGRAKALPPAPPELQGKEVKFSFESPVERIRKQIEAASLLRTLELMNPLIAVKPEMLDHLDTDQIMRDVPEATGMPNRWLLPVEIVEGVRQQQAEAEQQAAAVQGGLEAAERVAGIVKDVGPIIEGEAEEVA